MFELEIYLYCYYQFYCILYYHLLYHSFCLLSKIKFNIVTTVRDREESASARGVNSHYDSDNRRRELVVGAGLDDFHVLL